MSVEGADGKLPLPSAIFNIKCAERSSVRVRVHLPLQCSSTPRLNIVSPGSASMSQTGKVEYRNEAIEPCQSTGRNSEVDNSGFATQERQSRHAKRFSSTRSLASDPTGSMADECGTLSGESTYVPFRCRSTEGRLSSVDWCNYGQQIDYFSRTIPPYALPAYRKPYNILRGNLERNRLECSHNAHRVHCRKELNNLGGEAFTVSCPNLSDESKAPLRSNTGSSNASISSAAVSPQTLHCPPQRTKKSGLYETSFVDSIGGGFPKIPRKNLSVHFLDNNNRYLPSAMSSRLTAENETGRLVSSRSSPALDAISKKGDPTCALRDNGTLGNGKYHSFYSIRRTAPLLSPSLLKLDGSQTEYPRDWRLSSERLSKSASSNGSAFVPGSHQYMEHKYLNSYLIPTKFCDICKRVGENIAPRNDSNENIHSCCKSQSSSSLRGTSKKWLNPRLHHRNVSGSPNNLLEPPAQFGSTARSSNSLRHSTSEASRLSFEVPRNKDIDSSFLLSKGGTSPTVILDRKTGPNIAYQGSMSETDPRARSEEILSESSVIDPDPDTNGWIIDVRVTRLKKGALYRGPQWNNDRKEGGSAPVSRPPLNTAQPSNNTKATSEPPQTGVDVRRPGHSLTDGAGQTESGGHQTRQETKPLIDSPVWVPPGSPSVERKQFRPVRFDSRSLNRNRKSLNQSSAASALATLNPSGSATRSVSAEGLPRSSGSTDRSSVRLPRTQNATVTLLQRARSVRNSEKGGDVVRCLAVPVTRVDGVGPTTSEGMPVALRSTLKSENKSEWYKRVYDNLHKQPEEKDVSAGNNCLKQASSATEKDENFVPSRSSLKDLPRYRGQPGRIENYIPGRSSLAKQQESQTSKSATSKSSQSFTDVILSEDKSDSYVYNRKEVTGDVTTSNDKRRCYSQIQRGADIPTLGLQRPAPEKSKGNSHQRYQESNINIHYPTPVRWEEKESISEEELQRRQVEAMRKIYRETEAKKQQRMLEDRLSRRHCDNFLPSQKSPIPLNRYDHAMTDQVDAVLGGSTPIFATVMHDFQAQNARELGVSRGDSVRVRRQVDSNWYEAQRGTRVGIIPCSYVQINDPKRRAGGASAVSKMRVRYNFTAQNNRELNLLKGDVITVLRQIDQNWLEGRLEERTGIFPSSYVEPFNNNNKNNNNNNNNKSSDQIDMKRFNTSVTKPVGSPAAHGLVRPTVIGGSTSVSTRIIDGSTKTNLDVSGAAIQDWKPPLTYRAMYPYMRQNDDEMELREGDILTVVEQCADGW